jgi:hypothetical protein
MMDNSGRHSLVRAMLDAADQLGEAAFTHRQFPEGQERPCRREYVHFVGCEASPLTDRFRRVH